MPSQYFRFCTPSGGERPRSKRLERLLARAEECVTVEDWRAEAFDLIAAPGQVLPGLAAAALYPHDGVGTCAWVLFATPVRYVAEISNVRMAADAIISLAPQEAAALASDFNEVWHDAGMRLCVGDSNRLYCQLDRPLPAQTHDPADLADRRIAEFLPTGAGGGALRRLMSEIEMWLFNHAVNEARIRSGAAAIGGLWLWGGGAPLTRMPVMRGWAAGNDPFFERFSLTGGGTSNASGVIILADVPGSPGWRAAEIDWLEPAEKRLRSGHLEALHFSSGTRRCTVSARGVRRFWRRSRSWWEHLA